MGLHSRWTTGGLEFFQAGTTYNAFTIPKTGHPFKFGEEGEGFDIYFYGDTTSSYLRFNSSGGAIEYHGVNVTYDAPARTDSTGTGTTGTVVLTTLSNRRQFIGPTTGLGDILVKLPATSESQGIDFLIWNTWTSGGGEAPAGAPSLQVTTTGMGATTGTILQVIVPLNYGRFYADGLTWRSEKGTS